ncbi:hypothetical protein FQN54_009609 [Arachnomyces sp. PD_36]|nr:hypothetical protein FQN54_009609 [Arachnomyces sp. PD_36]
MDPFAPFTATATTTATMADLSAVASVVSSAVAVALEEAAGKQKPSWDLFCFYFLPIFQTILGLIPFWYSVPWVPKVWAFIAKWVVYFLGSTKNVLGAGFKGCKNAWERLVVRCARAVAAWRQHIPTPTTTPTRNPRIPRMPTILVLVAFWYSVPWTGPAWASIVFEMVRDELASAGLEKERRVPGHRRAPATRIPRGAESSLSPDPESRPVPSRPPLRRNPLPARAAAAPGSLPAVARTAPHQPTRDPAPPPTSTRWAPGPYNKSVNNAEESWSIR